MKKETAVASIIVLGVVAFMVGYFLGGSLPEDSHGHGSAAGEGAADSSLVPIGESPVWMGSEHAAATIVFFTDFTNEAAARTVATLGELANEERIANDSVRLVVKFLPGDDQVAREAAIAAIYGADEGNFDGVFDALVDGREGLDSDRVRAIVAEAGLDPEGYDAALEAEAYTNVLNADRALARSLGVRRAPGLVINGRGLASAQLELDAIREVLLGEVASVEAAIEGGDYGASQAYAMRTRENAQPITAARTLR